MESLGHVIVRMPSASTFRRALHRVDIQALEREMARLGQELDADEGVTGSVVGPQGEELRGQAVDGKEVRGASAHGEKVKLVSLVRHGSVEVTGRSRMRITTCVMRRSRKTAAKCTKGMRLKRWPRSRTVY